MFAHYDILAPPLARLPAGFELSYAGVPVAPLLRDNALARQIEERCRQLSERKRAMARYSRTSAYWRKLFKKERAALIELCGTHRREIHPDLRNPEGRQRFWAVPGRTTSTVIDAARREESMRRRNAVGNVGIDSDAEEAGSDADNVVNDGDCGSVIVD